MTFPGYIYAIESGDAVKIGFAKDPARRRSELNVGTPSRLRLLGFIEGDKFAEAILHDEFASLRIRGELFRNEGAVARFIAALPALPMQARKPKTQAAKITCAALRRFLSCNAVTQAEFAKSIGATQQAVALWMRGKRTPRPEFMRRIMAETEGAVTPNDFLAPAEAAE